MVNRTATLYICKALRSVNNGALAVLLIYFYYKNVYYQAAKWIALDWAFMALAALAKSCILLKLANKIGNGNVLLTSYLLQMITLIVINLRDLFVIGN